MTTFFELLFYAYGAIVLLHEYGSLKEPAKRLEMSALLNGTPTTEWRQHPRRQEMLNAVMFTAGYFAWLVIGMCRWQWPAFLFILLLSMVPKKNAWLMRVDALLSVLIVIFIILNKYQLRIDLPHELFKVLGL